MSAPQFTPGPWHAWMEGKTICVLGKERSHRKPVVAWMGFDGCNRALAKQKANARLIAAAPELYAALEGVLNHALCRVDGSTEQTIRTALAKARGAQ